MKIRTMVRAITMRVLRTTASTLLGIIGTVHMIEEVKWNAVLPTILISMVASILMCIISLPETNAERVLRESNGNVPLQDKNALESEIGGETANERKD